MNRETTFVEVLMNSTSEFQSLLQDVQKLLNTRDGYRTIHRQLKTISDCIGRWIVGITDTQLGKFTICYEQCMQVEDVVAEIRDSIGNTRIILLSEEEITPIIAGQVELFEAWENAFVDIEKELGKVREELVSGFLSRYPGSSELSN